MDKALTPALTGYRAVLPLKNQNFDDGTGYGMIRFSNGWHFYLPKANKAKCRCVQCLGQISMGEGIWQKKKGGHRGYTCLKCVEYLVKKYAPRGFTEDVFLNLFPAHFDEPLFTVDQVLASIKPAADIKPKES